MEIRGLSPTTLGAGQSAQLQYRVSDGSEGVALPNQIDINVSSGELSCSGDCGSNLTFDPGEQKDFTATLKAPSNLAPGSSKKVTVTVSANGDGRDDSKSVEVTLRGPDKPKTIKSISGRVVDVATGKAISDATVALNDNDDHRYNTQTDGDGDFKFTSSDQNPISPGEILLAAGKEGFQNNRTSTNVRAGQAKTGLRITLKSTAAPSPTVTSASPTPVESTAPPSEVASSDESFDPAAAGSSGSDSGSGLFSWVLIILGGLLVALGVGAIVLLVIRRKDGGEDDTGDALPGPNGPRPTPGARGVYHGGPDPTMVGGGAAMGANPTMAMRPGLADAPTMMHRPVDEYGDPYGTPLRAPQPTSGPPPGGPPPGYGYPGASQGGYGAGGSPAAPMGPGSPGTPAAYGSATPTAYGGGPTGRASASVSPPDPYSPREYDPPAAQPYGPAPHDAPAPVAPPASQGGYGYDEPTGRYDPNGGYGQASGGYDQASGGYDQERGGYGHAGAGDGYDAGYGSVPGNGYGRHDGGYAPGANGGYDAGRASGGYGGDGYPAPSGYPPQGGYDGYGQQQGGYPSYDQGGQGGQGGYDQPAGYDRGPDQPQRGYDQGYHDEPPTTRGDRDRRSSRRSLDWLDD